MNIMIIGCGKVGSELAALFSRRGHDVSVVDRREEKFDELPGDFSGFTTVGVPIDQDILKKAGIETCDAVCAVTPDDNMNIMAAQLAKEVFNVPRVFARISDVDKVDVFRGFGIHTVCPTKLTAEAACAAIEDVNDQTALNIDHHRVNFTTMAMPPEFVGKQPSEIELEPDEILFAIIRQNGSFLLYNGQVITLGETDRLVFAKKA